MDFRKPFYALIGAGEAAIETGKTLVNRARGVKPEQVREGLSTSANTSRRWINKRYTSWAKRGQRLSTQVGKSAPAKRAAAQTKQARSQVKAAATSIRKAVGAQADAAKTAAKKVG
jgi:transposase